jgi:hypothetical protein
MESRNKPSDAVTGAKKPYSKPKLEIYGDIADITQNVGKTGKADNPPTNPNKFRTA